MAAPIPEDDGTFEWPGSQALPPRSFAGVTDLLLSGGYWLLG